MLPEGTPQWAIDRVPVAILAGGLATRLLPVTLQLPKSLVPVAGRPFVDHQLSLLARRGVRRVVFCLGHLGEQVEQHVGDGSHFGMVVRYSHDGPHLLGTGGALRRALPLLDDVFWVLYGDSYLDLDYQEVLDHFLSADALGLMTVVENNNRWDRSNVLFREGRLVCYSKRLVHPQMAHIDYGLSLLRGAALERIPASQASDLAQLYSELVSEGTMIGHEVLHRFYEIGSPAGRAETEEYLLARGA